MGEAGNNPNPMPRWAAELGEATWDRIHELLADGHTPAEIMRLCGLCEKGFTHKRRSLELYARKYAPRFRLKRLAQVKDALIDAGVDIKGEIRLLLKRTFANALDPGAQPELVRRTMETTNEVLKMLLKLCEQDTEEAERIDREERTRQPVDPGDIVERIKSVYGIR